jgi:hypothetical protein
LARSGIISVVNTTTPALVTQRGARRLPRLALLLLCAVYVLPGLIGRDPWRNADLIAFGQMLGMAEGRTSWLQPTLGGLPLADLALLPQWLGAAFIWALSPLVDSAMAARLPFALLLAGVLALTWYATFHLARTDNAQPMPFAFGGEADPVDYARAVADGALLALIATLGLLQLGHETTPELLQLFAASLFLYALAAAPYRDAQPRLAVLAALPVLVASGAPSMALALGVGGTIVCLRSAYPEVRGFSRWVIVSTLLALMLTWLLGAWRWRGTAPDAASLLSIGRQWLWFLWPAWPLVLWTLWRWRGHLLHRHLSVPLTLVAVALGANLVMGGSDRALMLGTPALAVLAAFALPTFKRSTSAAMDWFSIFFFTLSALTVWVIYIAVHTGVPAKPAANVAKLAPGFVASFSLPALVFAVAATLAWVWLVRWRTGRHREALWKSLVLPAGGVALSWLLLMTLWLPLLDYARSSRAWLTALAPHVQAAGCIWAPGASAVTLSSLEHIGRYDVDASPESRRCNAWVHVSRDGRAPEVGAGWLTVAEVRRPTDRDEITFVYRRHAAP